MAIAASSCTAVILAGGISRRMGRCKALLPLDGQSMLLRTRNQLSDFDSVLLSCNDMQLADGFRAVPDLFPDAGPLAGIHASLLATDRPAIFVVPCDLPYFSGELPRLMLSAMDKDADVMVCRDGTGSIHPLCGIYRRRILPELEACLRAGQHRIMDFVRRVSWQCLETGGLISDRVFFNMNTPADYRAVSAGADKGPGKQ